MEFDPKTLVRINWSHYTRQVFATTLFSMRKTTHYLHVDVRRRVKPFHHHFLVLLFHKTKFQIQKLPFLYFFFYFIIISFFSVSYVRHFSFNGGRRMCHLPFNELGEKRKKKVTQLETRWSVMITAVCLCTFPFPFLSPNKNFLCVSSRGDSPFLFPFLPHTPEAFSPASVVCVIIIIRMTMIIIALPHSGQNVFLLCRNVRFAQKKKWKFRRFGYLWKMDCFWCFSIACLLSV